MREPTSRLSLCFYCMERPVAPQELFWFARRTAHTGDTQRVNFTLGATIPLLDLRVLCRWVHFTCQQEELTAYGRDQKMTLHFLPRE